MEENRYDVTTTENNAVETAGGNAELGAAILVAAGAATGVVLWESGKRLIKWAKARFAKKKPEVVPGEVVEGVAVEVEDSEEEETEA